MGDACHGFVRRTTSQVTSRAKRPRPRGATDSAELIRNLRRSSGIGLLARDRGAGRVRVTRGGRLSVRYRVADDDARRIRVGIEGAARILESAGAKPQPLRVRTCAVLPADHATESSGPSAT